MAVRTWAPRGQTPVLRVKLTRDHLSTISGITLDGRLFMQVRPDLNPDEGIWNYLKRIELGNVCCTDLDHLQRQLIRARERLRHKTEIIKSCSRQCGYSL